jgi:hypothetical protein
LRKFFQKKIVKKIFEKYRDFIFDLYEKDLPKTRNKQLIIYSCLISCLDIEYKNLERLENRDDEDKLRDLKRQN